jgi:ADP-ribose 1''-phosphate phosphatase
VITEIKGNLFDAPKGTLLVHACNTQGVWSAGIAASFSRLYPSYFKAYAQYCHAHGSSLLGTALILEGQWHKVGCLFTSTGYGSKALYQDAILDATFKSLVDLFDQVSDTEVVNMPRINSGLFRVPWESTLEVLKSFEDREIRIWIP